MSFASAPPVKEVEAISLRGRLGLAAACLEELAKHLVLRGSRWDDLVERVWRPVVAPADLWRSAQLPRNTAEVQALFIKEPRADDLDRMRRALHAYWNVRECALDVAASTRARSSEFLEELIRILEEAGATVPVAGYFASRSPIDKDGYGERGRAVPPAYFREGVAWEGIEPALRRGLSAIAVSRRRESAFAACHLGLHSTELDRVLHRATRDPDSEVRELATIACRNLGGAYVETSKARYVAVPSIPDFRSRMFDRDARWSPPISSLGSIAHDLGSRDAAVQRRAIERAGPFLVDSPELCSLLEERLQHDSADVRIAAAIQLGQAPFNGERLSLLLGCLDQEVDRIARAAIIFGVGCFGPRAGVAVPRILGCLDDVREPTHDPVAFYAAEALEAIGTASFGRIVAHVLSGDERRTERWLRCLVLRPDLGERVIEEITRRVDQGEEAWMMNRVQRALRILRPE